MGNRNPSPCNSNGYSMFEMNPSLTCCPVEVPGVSESMSTSAVCTPTHVLLVLRNTQPRQFKYHYELMCTHTSLCFTSSSPLLSSVFTLWHRSKMSVQLWSLTKPHNNLSFLQSKPSSLCRFHIGEIYTLHFSMMSGVPYPM